MAKTITEAQKWQLIGLKAAANSLSAKMNSLLDAALDITGEDRESLGHTGDLIWDDFYTVDTLLQRLEITVVKK